jgi:hypothetical protein
MNFAIGRAGRFTAIAPGAVALFDLIPIATAMTDRTIIGSSLTSIGTLRGGSSGNVVVCARVAPPLVPDLASDFSRLFLFFLLNL